MENIVVCPWAVNIKKYQGVTHYTIWTDEFDKILTPENMGE